MLRFYNTLSRKKEVFSPLEGDTVRMYSCGPTVYNYAHIGNLRTYIFMDLIRRTLRFEGYKIKGVMNITDVGHLMADSDDGEDKMAVAAREQKLSPWEIAEKYTKVFFEDLKKLNIGTPEIIAKATDHIPEMINYVQALEKAGFSYETSDGIYYDIAKFPRYGCLSGANLDDQLAGARVEVNSEKHHPADFALWKKADPRHIMQWDSPWGKGYPGWHIECSVMSVKNLGQPFDIHTGGVDLIFPHHENEIAQSTAGEQPVDYANFFVHNEHLLVDGAKMSKSAHNFYTLPDLADKGFSPLDFRMLVLQSHYRSATNFSWENLQAAQNRRHHWLSIAELRHQVSDNSSEQQIDQVNELIAKAQDAIEDDLDTPNALRVFDEAFDLFKPDDCNIEALNNLIQGVDQLLGLNIAIESPDIDPDDYELIDERAKVRQAKDWDKSDDLRFQLVSRGINVRDGKITTWSRY